MAPDTATTFGDVAVDKITAKAIRVLRDRKADKPAAAAQRVKVMRWLFAFAVEREFAETNPARDVKAPPRNSDGHHSWTIEEVAQYEARHPVGTQARLALALLLYTGQRISDVVRFGRSSVRGEWLVFTQHKNRNRKPVSLAIPIRPELAAVIAATDVVGTDAFLVSRRGTPFDTDWFCHKFRRWCDDAGLQHCSAHGLRKAAATLLAEGGATEQQIMAITGHRTSAEVTRYTRAARQRKLAAQAFGVEEGK